jgi:hypothetical protein
VWANRDWRLYAVARAAPLAAGTGRLTRLDVDAFTLAVARPGAVRVRVRWSPHWAVTAGAGCVARGPGDGVLVHARARGTLRVTQRVSVSRGIARSRTPRCRG